MKMVKTACLRLKRQTFILEKINQRVVAKKNDDDEDFSFFQIVFFSSSSSSSISLQSKCFRDLNERAEKRRNSLVSTSQVLQLQHSTWVLKPHEHTRASRKLELLQLLCIHFTRTWDRHKQQL